jgi:hypothetical protein
MEIIMAATVQTEVIMAKIRPFLLDIIIGAVFVLLPGIRGYSDWKIYEYALLLLIYGYIVYLHHKKQPSSE